MGAKASTAEERKDKLQKLKSAVEAHGDEIVAAVKQDTRKPENEIRVTEILNVDRQYRQEHQQSRRMDETRRSDSLPEQERPGEYRLRGAGGVPDIGTLELSRLDWSWARSPPP